MSHVVVNFVITTRMRALLNAVHLDILTLFVFLVKLELVH